MFSLSVCKHTGTSSLTKGLQNIVHYVLHVLRLNINRIKHDVILILFMLKVKTWKIDKTICQTNIYSFFCSFYKLILWMQYLGWVYIIIYSSIVWLLNTNANDPKSCWKVTLIRWEKRSPFYKYSLFIQTEILMHTV